MTVDEELKARLARGVDVLPVDVEASLKRFHSARPRRAGVKRAVTVAGALLVAVIGLALVVRALPSGSEREGPAASTGPQGTIGYMLVTADGEAASVYSTDVERPSPVAVESNAFSVYPVWSPDGSRVAFGSGYDQTELTVADADGSNARSLGVETRATFAWSPDGTRLAYVRADEAQNGFDAVAIVGSDGEGDRVVVRGLEWRSVAWSPDGEQLLLAGHPESENPVAGPDGWDLYTVRIDGTDLVQLTRSVAFEHFAAWSPDGSRIVFARSPNSDDADYPSDLWTINADGSDERRLTEWRGFDSFPAWSPDGSYIAFASDRDATPEERGAFENGDAISGISLFVMRADGSGVRRLLMAEDGEALLPGSWKA
jgi:Tol biopolymer transport system component